jgi:hypothetical protein
VNDREVVTNLVVAVTGTSAGACLPYRHTTSQLGSVQLRPWSRAHFLIATRDHLRPCRDSLTGAGNPTCLDS